MFGEAFEGEIEAGRLDYKRSLEMTKPKSWLKTVSAFANSQGGRIIFGVTDEGHEPVGLDDVQATVSKVAELIAAHIEPAVQYEFNVLRGKEGRPCLEVEVYRGLSTPYYYKHEQARMAFVRRGDRSEPATFLELGNLVLRGMNKTFDELPSNYMAGDLSFTLLSATCKQVTGRKIQGSQDMESMKLQDDEVLADVFARLHYMDRRGSGIGRILGPYQEYDRQPTFYSDAYMFLVTLPNCNYGVEGLVDVESLAVSDQEPHTSAAKLDTLAAKIDTSTTKLDTLPTRIDTLPARIDTSPARIDTSVAKPNTSDSQVGTKEQCPSEPNRLYHCIRQYLERHPRFLKKGNQEILLDLAQHPMTSFRRRDICQRYAVPPAQVAWLLQKCLDMGWVKRERYGVYRFAYEEAQ